MVKGCYDSGHMPFVIKGVNWSPATRAPQWAEGVPAIIKGAAKDLGDLDPSKIWHYGYFFDEDYKNSNLNGREVTRFWLRNEMFEEYERDLYLLEEMNANTIRITANLGSTAEDYDTFVDYINVVLDKCREDHLMVILTVALDLESDVNSQRYLKVVHAHKDHPAILMWAIGDEWNIRKYWDDNKDLMLKAEIVNKIASDIKSVDTHHPVCSILGDRFNDFPGILSRCPNVDAWGVNVYRKEGMRDFLKQWQVLNQSKPVFISGFGTDSFYTESCNLRYGVYYYLATAVKGHQDQQTQADVNLSLWNEIKAEILNKRCLGGIIYEFNDSLWKTGNSFIDDMSEELIDWKAERRTGNYSYKLYNDEGLIFTDVTRLNSLCNLSEKNYLILNIEHCGLVNADRVPKLVYLKMQEEWAKDIEPVIPNNPPVWNEFRSIENKPIEVRIEALKLLRFFVSASDPDGDPLTISVQIPQGITATFSDPGYFEWRPLEEDCGDYTVVFKATDSKGASVSQSIIITVYAVPRIDSLMQDSKDPKRYIITGNNFGKQGTESYLIFRSHETRIDPKYQIISWLDKEIIFQVNESSLTDGLLYCVEVHTFYGISNNRCFRYQAPKKDIELKHTPVTEAPKRQEIPIYVEVGNPRNLKYIWLDYYQLYYGWWRRRRGSARLNWIEDTSDGKGVYLAKIPATYVYGTKIKYVITATDTNGKKYTEEHEFVIK